MNKGFTIPELLVAVFAFSLIVGAAVNLLISGIGAQSASLVQQELLDQTSFLAEYMSRALRGAQKDLTGTCLSSAGLNYELTSTGSGGIKFLNTAGQCQEIYLQGTRIQQVILPSLPEFLTSDNLEVLALTFVLQGESQTDNLQPRVTFLLDIQGKGAVQKQPRVQLQTTISKRKVDVPQ